MLTCIFFICVRSEIYLPRWTATDTLIGERAMSVEWEGLIEGAALVRLTARINLACVKKSQGCNYTEMEGQRDGILFATAWTLLLSDCENGIYLVQRKETAHDFCLSTCPFAVPPHGLTHSIVVASFLSGHFFASINGNPTVQSFTEFFIFEGQWQPDMYSEEREDPVETDGKCWFVYRRRESQSIWNGSPEMDMASQRNQI